MRSSPGIPKAVRVVVLSGTGGHFSAGLDLSEHVQREPLEVMRHSRHWHGVVNRMQFCGVPGGRRDGRRGDGRRPRDRRRLPCATSPSADDVPHAGRAARHLRGWWRQRARSVRSSAPTSLTEMMRTGRTYDAAGRPASGARPLSRAGGRRAAEGDRAGAARSRGTRRRSNYLIIQSLARISNMSPEDGLYTESLAAGAEPDRGRRRGGLAGLSGEAQTEFRRT